MARSSFAQGNFGGLLIGPSGCLWGADDGLDHGGGNYTGAQGVETLLNRKMAIRNRHYDWSSGALKGPGGSAYAGQTYPGAVESGDKALGIVSMVSQEGAGSFPVRRLGQGSTNTATVAGAQGIDRITNGEWDATFRARADAMKALNYPIIYRLFMEMDGAHNPYNGSWQYGSGGTVADGVAAFVAAWRHVWSLFNARGATVAAGGNVIFCWCVQHDFHTPTDYKGYYPGDQYVDWIGVDLYRDTVKCGMDDVAGTGQDFYSFAQSHSKPVIIGEGGFEQAASASSTDSKVVRPCQGTSYDKDGLATGHSLILHTRDEIKASYPDIIAYIHWNSVGSVGNDLINTSATSLNQYRTWVNDPYFSAAPTVIGASATTTPPPGSTAPPTTTPPPTTGVPHPPTSEWLYRAGGNGTAKNFTGVQWGTGPTSGRTAAHETWLNRQLWISDFGGTASPFNPSGKNASGAQVESPYQDWTVIGTPVPASVIPDEDGVGDVGHAMDIIPNILGIRAVDATWPGHAAIAAWTYGDGSFVDQSVTAWANIMKQVKRRTLVRLWHEQGNGVYSSTSNWPLFISNWRKVCIRLRQLGALAPEKCQVVWCPASHPTNPNDDSQSFPGTYPSEPGGTDWIGRDVYIDSGTTWENAAQAWYDTFNPFTGPLNTDKVPLIVCESGIDSADPARITKLNHLFDLLKTSWHGISGWIWWDGAGNDLIDTPAGFQTAFRAGLADSYFLPSGTIAGTTPPPTTSPPSAAHTWWGCDGAETTPTIAQSEFAVGRPMRAARRNVNVLGSTLGGNATDYDKGYVYTYRNSDSQTAADASGVKQPILWSDITAGAHDAELTALFNAIKASSRWDGSSPEKTFHYSFHGEQVIDIPTTKRGYPSCGQPQDYISAYRHVRDLADSLGATVKTKAGVANGGNIEFCFVASAPMFLAPQAGLAATDFDPDLGSSPAPGGTSYYEKGGCTVYNDWQPATTSLKWGQDAQAVLSPVMTYFGNKGKKVILPEFAAGDGTTSLAHIAVQSYVRSVRAYVKSWGAGAGAVEAVMWNFDGTALEAPDSSAEAQAAYQEMGTDPWFLAGVTGVTTPPPTTTLPPTTPVPTGIQAAKAPSIRIPVPGWTSTNKEQGRVDAILEVGNRVFIGFNYTAIVNLSGASVTRNYICAIDRVTGDVVAFSPALNGRTFALASDNASRLWAGGAFTTVAGVARGHVAEFDLSSLALNNSGTANACGNFTGGNVRALEFCVSSLWVGGGFTSVTPAGGAAAARSRLAKMGFATTGVATLNAMNVQFDDGGVGDSVRDIRYDAARDQVIVGGWYTSSQADNESSLQPSQQRISAYDRGSGNRNPWTSHGGQSGVVNSSGGAVSVSPDEVLKLSHVTSDGFIYAAIGGSGGRIAKFSAAGGALSWSFWTDGNCQAIDNVGDNIIVGGHHGDNVATEKNRTIPNGGGGAFDAPSKKIFAVDAAGNLLAWRPTLTSTDGVLGVFEVTVGQQHIYYGGDFTQVNGVAQERFARHQIIGGAVTTTPAPTTPGPGTTTVAPTTTTAPPRTTQPPPTTTRGATTPPPSTQPLGAPVITRHPDAVTLQTDATFEWTWQPPVGTTSGLPTTTPPPTTVAPTTTRAPTTTPGPGSTTPPPTTAPPSTGAGTWTLLFISDGSAGGTAPNDVATQVAQIVSSSPSNTRVVYGGDVYASGTVSDFANFFNIYGSVAGAGGFNLIPYMMAIFGNHDSPHNSNSDGYVPFWNPAGSGNGKGGLTQVSPFYYSRTLGNGWEVVLIDGAANSGYSGTAPMGDPFVDPNSSAQMAFVSARATATAGRKKIAVCHWPTWNAGSQHGLDQAKQGTYPSNMRSAWEKLFSGGSARFRYMLSGHEHNMQMFPDVDAAGTPSPSNGVAQVICGASGVGHYTDVVAKGSYPVAGRYPDASNGGFSNITTFGFVRLDLRADGTSTVSFISATGATLFSKAMSA